MNDLKGIIEDCNKSDLVSEKVIKKVIEIIGQEEWNDLHNEHSDICTTMGELIITLKGIPDLEKENEELRRNEFNARSCLELQQSQDKAILNYMVEQLTKAKDIIKGLLSFVDSLGNYSGGIFAKAEQFLSEDLEK